MPIEQPESADPASPLHSREHDVLRELRELGGIPFDAPPGQDNIHPDHAQGVTDEAKPNEEGDHK